MIRIVIRGYAGVFGDDALITDPSILQTLAGLCYDAERFTDFLDSDGRTVSEEQTLSEALEPGGAINFTYRTGEPLLTAITEYVSRRSLSSTELSALAQYTMTQWADGIGENLWCVPLHEQFNFRCLWSREDVKRTCPSVDAGPKYPEVEVIEL